MTLPYSAGFMYAASYSTSKDVSWTVCKSEPDLLKDLTFHKDGFGEKVFTFLLTITFIHLSISQENPETEERSNTKDQSEIFLQLDNKDKNSECPSFPSSNTSESANPNKVVYLYQ